MIPNKRRHLRANWSWSGGFSESSEHQTLGSEARFMAPLTFPPSTRDLLRPLTGVLLISPAFFLLGMEKTSRSEKQADVRVFPVGRTMAQILWKIVWRMWGQPMAFHGCLSEYGRLSELAESLMPSRARLCSAIRWGRHDQSITLTLG